MKKLFIAVFICFLTRSSTAQNNYTDSLKTVLANTGNPVKKFDLLNRIAEGVYVSGGGNIDSASCIEMVRIAQQLNNDSLLAIAYNQVGNYFFITSGDYSKTLEYFFKAIPWAEKAKDKRRLSSLYVDMATVYMRLNNYPEQLKNNRKAIENLPERTSPSYDFLAAQIQYSMSRYYLSVQNNDSALYYAQLLNETNLRLKSPVYEGAAHFLMGQVYDRRGDNVLAEDHLTRANLLSDSVPYMFVKLVLKPAYIDFLIRHNKIEEARIQARRLMEIGIKKNFYDVKRVAAGFLRNIHDVKHRADSAYYYARLESAMKDSVFSQDNFNKIQALAFSEQLRVIEEDAKQAAEEKRRQRNIYYALIALGIITFIILFLLLSHRVITNVKTIGFLIVVALLIVFEFLNLLLHPFLEKITHHNPALMLLALVCIAALLVPIHHRLEKWAKHTLVEKNKQIRLTAKKKKAAQPEKNNS